jgi:hypothetical protein
MVYMLRITASTLSDFNKAVLSPQESTQVLAVSVGRQAVTGREVLTNTHQHCINFRLIWSKLDIRGVPVSVLRFQMLCRTQTLQGITIKPLSTGTAE